MSAPLNEPAPAEPVIEMREVRRTYFMGEATINALDGVDLTIEKGELVAIMGPSGSGKSTMLNVLGCLDTPTGGFYSLRGRNVGALTDDALAGIRNDEIGFIFQDFNLLPRLTAQQNVELPLVYGKVPLAERRRRAEELLATVGLADRAGHRPDQLSGGQRQRVAIARSMARRPSILLADEPTGNLDTGTSEEILDLFQEINGLGNTVVLVTHDMEIAWKARRVVYMRDGKIEKDSKYEA